jgi:hypothetical protein
VKLHAHAIYSFTSDGGAISTITPKQTAFIPANAVLMDGMVNVTTQCADSASGTATVSVGVSNTLVSGTNTTCILGVSGGAIANLTTDALIRSLCNTTPVKTSTSGYLTVTIATHALSAGVIEIDQDYYVTTNA